MWKRIFIPGGISFLFIASTALFWHLLRGFYETPFTWTRFNNDFNLSLIPVGLCLVTMIFFSSLLTLVKSHSRAPYLVNFLAGLTFAAFLPVTVFTALAALIFAIGFSFYEWATSKIFHSFIKIDFWDTYVSTIPTLITFLTVVMCLIQLQASFDKINQLKISVPRDIVEKAFITTPSTQPAPKSLIPGVDQITQMYKDAMVNQVKQQLEDQISVIINKYSDYIPLINALASFFLIGILNLPVMMLSIGLVVATMDLLRFLKVIKVVKIKTEVERFAW